MIQINLLMHHSQRMGFTIKSLNLLRKIKQENKSKIKLNIISSYEHEFLKTYINDLIDEGINCNVSLIHDLELSNYMTKIYSCPGTDCEYSCSMDDDILTSNHVWDYIIENISVLDSRENLFIAPLISNGIPSTDLFIEDFLSSDEKREIYDIFAKTHIENMWGANYEILNQIGSEWDYKKFYKLVSEINHYYKGIHPVRVSTEAQSFLAYVICNNIDKFLKLNDFKIEQRKFPYFCNSFFFIRTDTWKKIINDSSLYRDPFDEVPLNLYMELNNLHMVFIRNAFCIHMAYNTIGGHNQFLIENYYKKYLKI